MINATVGTSYKSDVALDNIFVAPGRCVNHSSAYKLICDFDATTKCLGVNSKGFKIASDNSGKYCLFYPLIILWSNFRIFTHFRRAKLFFQNIDGEDTPSSANKSLIASKFVTRRGQALGWGKWSTEAIEFLSINCPIPVIESSINRIPYLEINLMKFSFDYAPVRISLIRHCNHLLHIALITLTVIVNISYFFF